MDGYWVGLRWTGATEDPALRITWRRDSWWLGVRGVACNRGVFFFIPRLSYSCWSSALPEERTGLPEERTGD